MTTDLTRRDLLRGTAALALLQVPLVRARATAAPRSEVRVGLVGCGSRGTGAALQALRADPDAVLVAMGDVFEDRLERSLGHLREEEPARANVPRAAQFAGFDAFESVIERSDVVILATPPHFRPAHLRACVDARRHVFCEKPLAVDSTGVRSVLASSIDAARADLCLSVGFCWRYGAAERATYRRIREGALGEVVSVQTTYHTSPLGTFPRRDGWSDMEWQLRNWWHFRWLSGDHIVEQACHAIDKINWAMDGEFPLRATALGGRQMRSGPESGNVYDHFTVVYEYEGGRRCVHTCRQMAGCANDNADYITGTKGTCHVDGWVPIHEIRGENPWRYDGERPDMYQVEHDELFAAIRAGVPLNDGPSAAASTLMAIMGRMSAYSGQPVTWQEALDSAEDWTPAAYTMGELPVDPVALPGGYSVPPAVS
jgi:predicted dehydrogenase